MELHQFLALLPWASRPGMCRPSRTDFSSICHAPHIEVPAALSPSGDRGQHRGQIKKRDTLESSDSDI